MPLALPGLDAAFTALTRGNTAGAVTVVRDGALVDHLAFGSTLGGAPLTPSTPLVLASVSKLLTADTIAKLVEADRVALDEPVPWTAMELSHDPAWNTVTIRELLSHTSGMPIARASWLNEPGSCSIPLQEALASPPRPARGTWVYSNGNYCALGILISLVTGMPLDGATRQLVLDPLRLGQAHLTTDAPLPSDGPYPQGTGRLDRLGGAGTWMASSDSVATMVAAITPADRLTLAPPGIFTDQYGWGHTGTVDGAKSCAWQLEGGRTTIAAIIIGNRPSSGGRVCDLVLPALAGDLGLPAPKPVRFPD
ncbi:MAG: serine hydrolase domain-containing protein [Ilumatobacteraceae bacterium]